MEHNVSDIELNRNNNEHYIEQQVVSFKQNTEKKIV